MKKFEKNMNIQLSNEVWKKLKIMSIDKEISFGDLVRDILEKHINKKFSSSEDKQ